MSKTIRREIQAVNVDVVQRDPVTVDDILREASYARPRFSVFLMGMFSIIGLVLLALEFTAYWRTPCRVELARLEFALR